MISDFMARSDKMKVTFVMKSGKEIIVECDDCKFKHTGDEIVEYSLTGVNNNNKLLFIKLSSIDVILIEK